MDQPTSGANSLEEMVSTAPTSFNVQARGFADTETATRLATFVGETIRALGKLISLQSLDGVTIAYDYDQALLELDRGYETSHQLKATNSHVLGVAMTPSVIREGQLKSHIFVRAETLLPLLDPNDEAGIRLAVHLLAHECGHVEVTQQFERCFPGVLLRGQMPLLETLRWDTIFGVWDEYAVTWIAANISSDPTASYNQALLTEVGAFDERNNAFIRDYRWHSNVDQILSEIHRSCGNLLKFAGYAIGNLRGKNLSWRDSEDLASVLTGHWFEPFLQALCDACEGVASNYGEWTDMEDFKTISAVLDDLVCRAGLFITEQEDGGAYVHIPFTDETM